MNRGDYGAARGAQGPFSGPKGGIPPATTAGVPMPICRHSSARLPPVAAQRKGGALLETIIAMTIVAIFLSGLHLTNSQVMSQVRASLESVAALRDLSSRTEQVRDSTWSQITDPNYLQSTLFVVFPDSTGELGNLVETIEVKAHLAAPGTVTPITVTRLQNGTTTVVNPGGATMPDQPSVRVDLTAAWSGKGGRARTRQMSLVVAQGGLIGRN